MKLFLGGSLSGGGLEALGNLDESQKWVGYTRTALEAIVLILLTVKDVGQFEKKMQKFNQASTLLTSFHNLIQQQMRLKQGFEGDREEVIKEFTETFESIKGSNAIIQELGIQEDMKAESFKKSKSVTFDQRKSEPESFADAETDAESDISSDEVFDRMERGTRMTAMQSRRGTANMGLINEMMNRM